MRAVARPTWQANDEQKKLVGDAIKAIQRVEAAEADAWAKLKKARDAGVPDTQLCSATGIPRSTLIRKLGPRAADD